MLYVFATKSLRKRLTCIFFNSIICSWMLVLLHVNGNMYIIFKLFHQNFTCPVTSLWQKTRVIWFLTQTCWYISNWICQKVPAEMVKTSQFCCRHKIQKATHPTPGGLVTELPISHPLHTVAPLCLVIKSKLSIRPSLAQEKIAKAP